MRYVIAIVILLNCAGVFVASIFAIDGEGRGTGVYTVLAIGLTWVAAVGVAAFHLDQRGVGAVGLVLTLCTLPAGFMLSVLGLYAWQTFWFYWPDPSEFKAACSSAHTRYLARPARPVESLAFERAAGRQPSVVINHIRLEAGTRVVSMATENFPFPESIKFTEFKAHAPYKPQGPERYYRSVGTYGKPEEIAGFTADVLVSSRYTASEADLGRSLGKQGLVGYEFTVVDRRDGRTLGSMRYYTHLEHNRACGEAQDGVLNVREFILEAVGVSDPRRLAR